MNRIRSEEIAKEAGVSRSTVSKVINGYGDVGEDTRKRVLAIVGEYGYSPNLAARILAGKSVETIGLFFFVQQEQSYQLSDDSIVDQMITGVVDAAAHSGFLTLTVIIRNADGTSEQKIKEIFRQGRIDAGIFMGCRSSEPIVEELVSQGYLIGVLDYPRPEVQEQNRIIMNYAPDSGERAVDYLVSIGHRKIMGIQGDQFRHDGKNKYSGFLSGLKRHGIDLPGEWDLKSSFYLDGSTQIMESFLESGVALPTAVFCANDHIAFDVLHALQKRGIAVPGDISVIGIDDAMPSRYIRPALTTYRVDFPDMLGRFTRSVIEAVTCLPETPVYMECGNSLIERESCAHVK